MGSRQEENSKPWYRYDCSPTKKFFLFIYGIILLILNFWLSPFYLVLAGFPLVVLGAFLLGRKGGIITATWATLTLTLAVFLTNPPLPLLGTGLFLYYLTGLALGQAVERRGSVLLGLKQGLTETGNLLRDTPLGIYNYQISGGWPEEEYVSPNLADTFTFSSNIFAPSEGQKDSEQENLETRRNRIPELYQQGEVTLNDYTITTKEGDKRWVQEKQRLLEYEEYPDQVIGMLWDITEERRIEQELKLHEFSMENAAEMIFRVDREGYVQYANQTAADRLSYPKEDLIGSHVSRFVPDYTEDFREEHWDNLKKAETITFEERFNTGSGEIFPVRVNTCYQEYMGEKFEFVFVQDITELKDQEEQLKYILYHDSLTDLYNRRFFDVEMQRLDTERQLPLSIIMADLNGLKIINDAFGHQRGDDLICQAGNILETSCREEDIVARWAGDEFVVLLPQTNSREAANICERVERESQRRNHKLDIPVSLALGTATKTKNEQDIATILQQAEEKMYDHKLSQSSSIKQSILEKLLECLQSSGVETEDHVTQVDCLSRALGREIGLSTSQLEKLSLLAVIHDIGKSTWPDEIIEGKQDLDDKDWEEIRRHPERGYRIAASTEKFAGVAEEILSHHENWDGSGYPRGLEGEEIPLLARVIAIADAYDVMIHEQPYKPALEPEVAKAKIEAEAGSQFDPHLVDVFLEIV